MLNGAILGLLMIGLAQGIASVACFNLLTNPVSRLLPGLLTLGYYAAMIRWPHGGVVAARTGAHYPDGDQIRLMLLGLATFIAVISLTRELSRRSRA